LLEEAVLLWQFGKEGKLIPCSDKGCRYDVPEYKNKHKGTSMSQKTAQSPRYLTKSRFKLACECPTKLFYTRKDEYPDQKKDDPFMAALAEGGFQVGELAKLHYPGGLDVKEKGYDAPLKVTNDYIDQNPDEAIIYEAAVRYKNLFIRVDVFIKRGNRIQLIEVKAKSFDSRNERPFLNGKGYIASGWKDYLYDVAFQKYVIQKAFPDCVISSYLMLVDKAAVCVEDGLNQKFKIVSSGDMKEAVQVGDVSQAHIDSRILKPVSADHEVNLIECNEDSSTPDPLSFEQRINLYADAYVNNKKIFTPISKSCEKCEFRATDDQLANEKKDGFKECWKHELKWKDSNFEQNTVLDIWNFHGKDKLIKKGTIRMVDVHEEDISPDPMELGEPMSNKQRQWMQIDKYKNKDNSVFIDKAGLAKEIANWNYPLHFIDFETSRVAIPFYAGRKPYEQMAFQFSHHVIYEDGRVQHKGQYLNADSEFPNYEFLRALKMELEGDEGTIFRYSYHENTVLNEICDQLEAEINPPHDKRELIDFVHRITYKTGVRPAGPRCMVDLCKSVQDYTFYPSGRGRTSIKVTLPAILNNSAYLQSKYSKPIYGVGCQINSLNFTDPMTWIEIKGGVVVDPYKRLPAMFQDWSDEDLERIERLSEEEGIKEGGAAMMAWAKMHFTEMSEEEKGEIKKALLKYCELDTLAMVMIFEDWKSRLS